MWGGWGEREEKIEGEEGGKGRQEEREERMSSTSDNTVEKLECACISTDQIFIPKTYQSFPFLRLQNNHAMAQILSTKTGKLE